MTSFFHVTTWVYKQNPTKYTTGYGTWEKVLAFISILLWLTITFTRGSTTLLDSMLKTMWVVLCFIQELKCNGFAYVKELIIVVCPLCGTIVSQLGCNSWSQLTPIPSFLYWILHKCHGPVTKCESHNIMFVNNCATLLSSNVSRNCLLINIECPSMWGDCFCMLCLQNHY